MHSPPPGCRPCRVTWRRLEQGQRDRIRWQGGARSESSLTNPVTCQVADDHPEGRLPAGKVLPFSRAGKCPCRKDFLAFCKTCHEMSYMYDRFDCKINDLLATNAGMW